MWERVGARVYCKNQGAPWEDGSCGCEAVGARPVECSQSYHLNARQTGVRQGRIPVVTDPHLQKNKRQPVGTECMRWDELYDRASEYDITVAEIQSALIDRRKGTSNPEGEDDE